MGASLGDADGAVVGWDDGCDDGAPEGAGVDQHHAVLPDERQCCGRPALNSDPLGTGDIDHRGKINIIEINRPQGSVRRKVPELIDDQFTPQCTAVGVDE